MGEGGRLRSGRGGGGLGMRRHGGRGVGRGRGGGGGGFEVVFVVGALLCMGERGQLNRIRASIWPRIEAEFGFEASFRLK